jgi:hypothetical protein
MNVSPMSASVGQAFRQFFELWERATSSLAEDESKKSKTVKKSK